MKELFCFAESAKIAVNFSFLWKLLWISSLPYKGISTYKLNLLQKETIFLQRIFLGFFRDPLNSICFLEIGTLWKKHLILKKLKLLFFLFKNYTDWKALLLFSKMWNVAIYAATWAIFQPQARRIKNSP